LGLRAFKAVRPNRPRALAPPPAPRPSCTTQHRAKPSRPVRRRPRFAASVDLRAEPAPPGAPGRRAEPSPPLPVAGRPPEHRPCVETGRPQSTTAGRPSPKSGHPRPSPPEVSTPLRPHRSPLSVPSLTRARRPPSRQRLEPPGRCPPSVRPWTKEGEDLEVLQVTLCLFL
jgi:hypothetical protein